MTSATSDPREERLHELIAAFLDREAAGNPPERATWLVEHGELAGELRQFLEEHERLGRMGAPLRALAEPAGADAVTVGGATAATTESPAVVRSFGDFELLAEIARGGMGVVYKARQKSFDRLVALKMILAGQLATETDVQRFKTEAAAAGQLDHPNIVPVYDIGDHQGQHYFSMKLIEGDSLARAIAADRWPRKSREGQEAIAKLIARTARAVHYAHQRGILHRDLKPGNVLLDDRGEPHITDFGLAKRVGGESSLTHTGAVVGTPAYMPPEQASGNKQLTTAADVYSLGAILYEMATGRPPFLGDSALSILSQVCADEPTAPKALNVALDRDLATICLRSLEKDPTRRYASADALADDLERWLTGEPILARPSTAWERTVKWAKRRPAVAALLGVSVVSAAALLIGGLIFHAELQVALGQVKEKQQNLDQAESKLNDAKGKVAFQEKEATITNARAKELLAEATSWRLVARAELVRPTNPGLGLLLALEAARLGPRRADQNNALASLLEDCREQGPLLGAGEQDTNGMVRYFAGGKRVLTVSYDTVRTWDAATGAKLLEFTAQGTDPGHGGLRVGSVTISPDERLLGLTFEGYCVLYSKERKPLMFTDRAIRLYDLATGKEVRVLKEHGSRVTSVAFAPDGKRLVSGSMDGTVRLWELATGQELRVLRGHICGLQAVAFAKNDQVLTFATGEKARPRQPLQENMPPENVDPAVVGPLTTYGLGGSGTDSGSFGPGEELFACLWNADTGAKITEFRTQKRGQFATARGVALTPDGRRLVATHENAVSFWDGATGKELQPVYLKSDTLAQLQLSRDGKRALTMHRNYSARIWDVMEGKELVLLRGHTADLTSARFSPDDGVQFVLTTSDDKTARLWETATGKELMSLRGHEGRVRQADFHPTRPQVVTTANDHTVRFWNIALKQEYSRNLDPTAHTWWIGDDGETPTNYKIHKRAIWSAALSPDGSRVATGSYDGTLRLWDALTGKLLAERRGYATLKNPGLQDRLAREISAIAYSSDGMRVLTVSADSVAKLQETPGSLNATKPANVPYAPVRIYDATTGEELAAPQGHTEGIRSAQFSPDGTRVLTVADARIHTIIVNKAGTPSGSGTGPGKDRTARILDAKTGQQLHVFTGDWNDIYSACWDAKGQRVCTVHETFTFIPNKGSVDTVSIRVWDLQIGLETHKLVENKNNVNSVAFSPDGRRLLTWYDSRIRQDRSRGDMGVARVWDLASGKILFSMKGSHGSANHAAYSPDGRWIVTTGHVYNQSTSGGQLGLHGRLRDNNNLDRTARIWDAETGALVHVLYGHTQSVHDAAFSKDSRWLVTVSEDRTARVWETATGKEWITLRGHQDDVKTAQFSADAKTVLTVSWDGTARLWPVDPLPIAQQRRPRELTEEERERFEVKKIP